MRFSTFIQRLITLSIFQSNVNKFFCSICCLHRYSVKGYSKYLFCLFLKYYSLELHNFYQAFLRTIKYNSKAPLSHSIKSDFPLFVYIFMQVRRSGYYEIRVEKVKTMSHCLFPNYSRSLWLRFKWLRFKWHAGKLFT